MLHQIEKVRPLMGNHQMLDGGAMFGNVPKSLWSKWITANDNNQIDLACRSLLIQEKSRNILLETGIGAFFEPSLKIRYGVKPENHVLLDSLNDLNLSHEDIDIVILSHLHFDHAGGLLSAWQEDDPRELLFPNAEYVISNSAWERANNPHMRDKASFIPEIIDFLDRSGRVKLLKDNTSQILGGNYTFHYTNGHTPGLLHTEINLPQGPILFCSDLIPAIPWVHLPVTMGYDRNPELLINEKHSFLKYAEENNCRLFYTHDPIYALSRVRKDTNGRYAPLHPVENFIFKS